METPQCSTAQWDCHLKCDGESRNVEAVAIRTFKTLSDKLCPVALFK